VNELKPILLCATLVAPWLLGGCEKSDSSETAASASASSSAAPSLSAVAPVAEGLARTPAEIEKVVNPKREPAYAGPTGTVSGSVVIAGDQAPPMASVKEIPADCLAAREAYRDLFREGMLRSAADVFVAVTGYSGYVPARQDTRLVKAKGCAFETRTVGLTFGQALEVVSKDARPYVPELLGARTTAQMVATPGGSPVKLYPTETGRYVLVDSMRIFAKADVLVVAYSTFDVTGMDGKFEIKGVPVGKAKLDALLPGAMLSTHEEITVEAGKTVNVDLELAFDKARRDAARLKATTKTNAAEQPSASPAGAK
jgi:hypothetical protein